MARIFVTGATGYIAKHIVHLLLGQGHEVTGSTRDTSRLDELKAAVRPGLPDGAVERLSLVELDLTSDAGWDAVPTGTDAMIHTASPFPLSQPKNEEDLIRPAVDGTRRALRAAVEAGVPKVVLTSSIVSIVGNAAKMEGIVTEEDWTDPNGSDVSAYGKSKTLAERAAWDFVESEAPTLKLSVINPGLVAGPALDRHYGSSLQAIERVVKGKDPALPDFGFSVCDVRDVAEAHVIAATTTRGEGQRTAIVDRYMTFPDIAKVVDATLEDRRIPTRIAPRALVRVMALFDGEIRSILPMIGRRYDIDNTRMRAMMGRDARSAEEAVAETARFLAAEG